jgi:hypothetical protein
VDQAASPRDQGVEADDVSKSHVPPARDVAGGAASPQSTSVTVTDAYERDESKYVTTPETKYKNIAPTLPVESDQNPEIKPSTNGLVIHMDAISTRPKFDYSKASKKLKKRKPKTATSDGISTPSESAQMHTSESVESATSVLSLEKQLQVNHIDMNLLIISNAVFSERDTRRRARQRRRCLCGYRSPHQQFGPNVLHGSDRLGIPI